MMARPVVPGGGGGSMEWWVASAAVPVCREVDGWLDRLASLAPAVCREDLFVFTTPLYPHPQEEGRGLFGATAPGLAQTGILFPSKPFGSTFSRNSRRKSAERRHS